MSRSMMQYANMWTLHVPHHSISCRDVDVMWLGHMQLGLEKSVQKIAVFALS